MKHLDLSVYEPGEMIATLSKDGKVAVFTVSPDGALAPSDNRLFASGLNPDDLIEELDLTVRSYNVLRREGLKTIGEVMSFYDTNGTDGLLELRNLGAKGCDEIVGHINRLRGQS